MQKTIFLFIGLCWVTTGFGDSGVLTLEQALATARRNAPELRAARTKIQAAEQAVDGSIYYQSPSFLFEAEGVGGGAETEYTLSLEKEIRSGGKSKKERALAQQSVQVVKHTSSAAELELTARVQSAFYDVIAQQEISIVRSEQETLAREFVTDATKRFKAGAASELDVLQADLALEEVLIEKQCCVGDLDTAKKKLAALMGIPLTELAALEGNFYEVLPPDSMVISEQHPALKRLAAQTAQLQAAATLAISQDSPDWILGAGVRYNSAFSDPSYIFSASRPLAFSKRGHAEGAAHSLEAEAVNADREKVRRDLQIELSQFITDYQRSMNEASKYKTDLLPRAAQIYELSRGGYDVGRYSSLELIIAQQHLSQIRIRYIESLNAAHQAIAQMGKYTLEEAPASMKSSAPSEP